MIEKPTDAQIVESNRLAECVAWISTSTTQKQIEDLDAEIAASLRAGLITTRQSGVLRLWMGGAMRAAERERRRHGVVT